MCEANSSDVPFSISCIECDTDSPDSSEDAVTEGWTDMQFFPGGCSENYLGVCPVCRAEEERTEALLQQSFPPTEEKGGESCPT